MPQSTTPPERTPPQPARPRASDDSSTSTALAQMHAALALLDSPSPLHRLRGESRLARLAFDSGPEVIGPLLEFLESAPWTPRHAGILEAFKQVRPPEAVPVAAAYLEDSRTDVRLTALRTLRWLPVGLDVFVGALGDEDWRIRRESVFCISSRGGDQALLPLARALDDDHFQVRAAAANVMGMLGLAQAQPLLRRALRDESQRVKAMAAWSLARWQDQANTGALLEALPDAQGEAKERILHALRANTSPLVTAALLKGCEDQAPEVRAKATMILAHTGPAGLRKRLAVLFSAADKSLRHKAAWIVASLGIVSRDDLSALLRDADENVRYFAVCALGYDNLNAAHFHLLHATAAESRAVRKAAAHGLKRIIRKGPCRSQNA